jgi:hypothetical protein
MAIMSRTRTGQAGPPAASAAPIPAADIAGALEAARAVYTSERDALLDAQRQLDALPGEIEAHREAGEYGRLRSLRDLQAELEAAIEDGATRLEEAANALADALQTHVRQAVAADLAAKREAAALNAQLAKLKKARLDGRDKFLRVQTARNHAIRELSRVLFDLDALALADLSGQTFATVAERVRMSTGVQTHPTAQLAEAAAVEAAQRAS